MEAVSTLKHNTNSETRVYRRQGTDLNLSCPELHKSNHDSQCCASYEQIDNGHFDHSQQDLHNMELDLSTAQTMSQCQKSSVPQNEHHSSVYCCTGDQHRSPCQLFQEWHSFSGCCKSTHLEGPIRPSFENGPWHEHSYCMDHLHKTPRAPCMSARFSRSSHDSSTEDDVMWDKSNTGPQGDVSDEDLNPWHSKRWHVHAESPLVSCWISRGMQAKLGFKT